MFDSIITVSSIKTYHLSKSIESAFTLSFFIIVSTVRSLFFRSRSISFRSFLLGYPDDQVPVYKALMLKLVQVRSDKCN